MTDIEVKEYLEVYGKRAKAASMVIAQAGSGVKSQALLAAADAISAKCDYIISQNDIDIASAKDNGIRDVMIDRLKLTPKRIEDIAEGIRQVAALNDPIGEVVEGFKRPNGLEIIKKRVPLGVIGIIFESRPNVTADAAALCLKSGNACILRGGKEAIHSNLAIAEIFSEALEGAGLPKYAVQLIDRTEREIANGLMCLREYVDVLIPRGGKGLIANVVENAKVPVIQTGTGNCHIYIDDSADLDMACNIVINAKTQRPSVCNAMETLLVSENAAGKFLPAIAEKLKEKNVDLRGCQKTMEICGEMVNPADETDYATEFDDLILAVKVVKDVHEAIDHINKYGTGHSESIITKDFYNATLFQATVDAACVYVNASTRFTDGFEFGFGAEIGISNQKLHARGPMGLKELTTCKYIINGNGQIRQ